MATSTNPRHQLHNSLIAISVAVLVVMAGLFAARPLPTPGSTAAPLVQTAATAQVPELEAAAGALQDEVADDDSTDDNTRAHARPHRRSRQTLAMPYFSFAARS